MNGMVLFAEMKKFQSFVYHISPVQTNYFHVILSIHCYISVRGGRLCSSLTPEVSLVIRELKLHSQKESVLSIIQDTI